MAPAGHVVLRHRVTQRAISITVEAQELAISCLVSCIPRSSTAMSRSPRRTALSHCRQKGSARLADHQRYLARRPSTVAAVGPVGGHDSRPQLGRPPPRWRRAPSWPSTSVHRHFHVGVRHQVADTSQGPGPSPPLDAHHNDRLAVDHDAVSIVSACGRSRHGGTARRPAFRTRIPRPFLDSGETMVTCDRLRARKPTSLTRGW